MIRKKFFFDGNKERLQKIVRNAGGKLLSNQRFSVLVHDKSIHQRGFLFLRDGFCFRLYCRFQKMENGYEIRYLVTPDWWTLVRVVALTMLLSMLLSDRSVSICLAVLGFLLLLVNLVRQGVRCASQFEEMCKK